MKKHSKILRSLLAIVIAILMVGSVIPTVARAADDAAVESSAPAGLDGIINSFKAFIESVKDFIQRIIDFFRDLFGKGDKPAPEEPTEPDVPAEPEEPEFPEDAIVVNNVAELLSELANGGDIVLLEDIEIPAASNAANNPKITKEATLYASNGAKLSFENAATIQIQTGAKLTLSGVTIDAGQTFSVDADDKLIIDDVENRRTVPMFQIAEGGEIELVKGTVVSNNISMNGDKSFIYNNGGKVVLKDAIIRGNAGKSGIVVNSHGANAVTYIEEGTIIENNYSYDDSNHGLFKIDGGSKLVMNGGEIRNNIYNGNGLIGLQAATAMFEMNGGKIIDNKYVPYGTATYDDTNGRSNSRYCAIYVQANCSMVMNGGEISGNTVSRADSGAIDAWKSLLTPSVTLNGGTITNNYAIDDEEEVAVTVDGENSLVISADFNGSGLVCVFNPAVEDDWYRDINTFKK